jgi:hypothetical protein
VIRRDLLDEVRGFPGLGTQGLCDELKKEGEKMGTESLWRNRLGSSGRLKFVASVVSEADRVRVNSYTTCVLPDTSRPYASPVARLFSVDGRLDCGLHFVLGRSAGR